MCRKSSLEHTHDIGRMHACVVMQGIECVSCIYRAPVCMLCRNVLKYVCLYTRILKYEYLSNAGSHNIFCAFRVSIICFVYAGPQVCKQVV